MSKFTPTSFRLEPETLAAMRGLAMPHESLSSVLTRAIAALQASPAAPEALSGDALTDRIVCCEGALTALNSRLAGELDSIDNRFSLVTERVEYLATLLRVHESANHYRLQETTGMPIPETTSSTQETTGIELQETTGITQESDAPRRTRFIYPEATKRMAVDLLRSNPDITGSKMDAAILASCGHSLGNGNALRVVRKWATDVTT